MIKHLMVPLLFLSAMASAAPEILLSKQEVDNLVLAMKKENTATETLKKSVDIGHGQKVEYSFYADADGYGGIALPGIKMLRLFDYNGESSFFRDGLLKNELLDLNADGYKDILLWGTAVMYGENDELLGEKPVVAILLYQADKKRYTVVKRSDPIQISTVL